ncbi:type IV pilus biogenesis protein PilP [Herbaspirillum sp. ST 5-3]|uniref:type IV pilus biogenesis protein PilP n=1 Tax=Oxalobacteraceae TaxID=75682 RepID=UPI0010A3574E|nr:type IV pilus biogenesis protein PilP [Herbaspirillum sp. ST 5-3]
MRNNLKALILICGAAIGGHALAESASESLTRIEAETLILKAREKQLDIQARIIARQNEIAARQTDTTRMSQVTPASNPVIQSVEEIGGTPYATLQLDNGTLVDVKVGDELPNGMKIVSIGLNDVVVKTSKKRRIHLATAAQTATVFNPNLPRPGIGLPSLTPIAPQAANLPTQTAQPAVTHTGVAK